MSAPTDAARIRTGKLLERRRGELDPRYRVRETFAAENGVSARVVSDIEKARRRNFESATLSGLEAAYKLEIGSIERAWAGGELDPAPGTPGGLPLPGRETPAPVPAASVRDDRAKAVISAAIQGSPLEDKVREAISQHPPGTPGGRIFSSPADQAIWDDASLDEKVRIRMITTLWALRGESDTAWPTRQAAG